MNQDVGYGIALMQEQITLSGTWLLIRLGLKKLTIQEWHDLNLRTKFVNEAVARYKK